MIRPATAIPPKIITHIMWPSLVRGILLDGHVA